MEAPTFITVEERGNVRHTVDFVEIASCGVDNFFHVQAMCGTATKTRKLELQRRQQSTELPCDDCIIEKYRRHA